MGLASFQLLYPAIFNMVIVSHLLPLVNSFFKNFEVFSDVQQLTVNYTQDLLCAIYHQSMVVNLELNEKVELVDGLEPPTY